MNFASQLGVTLPIVMAILGAAWLQNRRIEELSKRFDDGYTSLSKRIDDGYGSLSKRIDDGHASLSKRIDDLRVEIMAELREIRAALKDLDRRVTILEERSSPIARG